jgi:hypothetical protein
VVKENKQAIILGNGESRLGYNYREKFPNATVFGCNGAYRESPDFLICTDVYMQHLIYKTGYCKDNLCYFSEWETLPGDEGYNLAKQLGKPVISNDRDNRMSCVVNGTENFTYVTWTEEEDSVQKLLEIPISSGSRALLLACELGFNEIHLLGFDGIGAQNVYQQTEGYENSTPREIWVKERNDIKQFYKSKIKFYDL